MYTHKQQVFTVQFLGHPVHTHTTGFYHAAECRRGLAMRILSVCLSVRPTVCLSNVRIVTKRKKNLSEFLYYTKDHLAYFSVKKE